MPKTGRWGPSFNWRWPRRADFHNWLFYEPSNTATWSSFHQAQHSFCLTYERLFFHIYQVLTESTSTYYPYPCFLVLYFRLDSNIAHFPFATQPFPFRRSLGGVFSLLTPYNFFLFSRLLSAHSTPPLDFNSSLLNLTFSCFLFILLSFSGL